MDDRTLRVCPRIIFGTLGALRIRRSNRGNSLRPLPGLSRHSPENCKVVSVSHTISSQPPPQALRRYGSVFLLIITRTVADDGFVYRVHCDMQVRWKILTLSPMINGDFRYLTYLKTQAFSLWRTACPLSQEEKVRAWSPTS